MSRLLCILGGTFDPVHRGHLHAAATVRAALDLEEVHLLLAARPGHRAEPGASADQRWEMLQLACAGEPGLVADATELRRAERTGRASYTVETLEALRHQAPERPLAWILGSDAFGGLPGWHRWREVLSLANLVVLQRPGADLPLPRPMAELVEQHACAPAALGAGAVRAGGILLLPAPMLDVSSSRVRVLLADGAAEARATLADLLPAAVYTYICEHHLYGVVGDP